MCKIFLFLIIICFNSFGQQSLAKIIVNDINKCYKNMFFDFIPICSIPTEIFDACHLPFLNKGQIIKIKDEGVIWCSSVRNFSSVGDSCYVVIKTKLSYNVEWWERSSKTWIKSKTQRVYKKS
jgi:hypothetical protein